MCPEESESPNSVGGNEEKQIYKVNFCKFSILQTPVIGPRTTVLSPPTSGTLAGVEQPGYQFRLCSRLIQGLGKERGV